MIDDSNPYLGLYDMTVDIPADAPKHLHRVMNAHICNKGGGGGSPQTTTTGIDPEFKPYLKRVLSDVTKKYEKDVEKGPDAIVAAMDPKQREAIDAQAQAARDMIAGTGIYDTRKEAGDMLKALQGDAMGQQAGSLGSARALGARTNMLGSKAYEIAQDKQALQKAGYGELGEAGSADQQYEQSRLDAPHTAASRYFGYLQNAPQQSTTTGGGGGGK